MDVPLDEILTLVIIALATVVGWVITLLIHVQRSHTERLSRLEEAIEWLKRHISGKD